MIEQASWGTRSDAKTATPIGHVDAQRVGPLGLVGLFVAVSALASLAVLALRNLYDDELLTLYLATGRVRTIFEVTAEGDVHPPGMYLIARLGWALTQSYRWLNLLPMAVLYAGLACFLVETAPLIRSRRGQICLLMLASFHPQLLLWSNTFRWYCPWTGLALIALTAALQPARVMPELSIGRGAAVGSLLGAMFYLNYITLLFAAALAVAMAVRYSRAPRKSLLSGLAAAVLVFGLLVSPQLRLMLTVHLPNGHAQRYGVAVSLLRLLQALGESEAFLPWHPLGLLALLGIAAMIVLGLRVCTRVLRGERAAVHAQSGICSIAVFSVIFSAAIALSGLGGKPRNGLLLIPVLGPVAALGFEIFNRRVQAGLLLLLSVWSGVGVMHLLGRYGLVKAGMTDRPEEVVAFVQQSLRASAAPSAGESTCAVVVTYDSALAFRLARASLPEHRIISPYGGPIFGGSPADLPPTCAHPRLFVVESYIGGSPADVSTYTGELAAAKGFFNSPPGLERKDPDPGVSRKRKLARMAGMDSADRLPEFRYTVHFGTMDGARYKDLARALPHFYSLQNDREDALGALNE